MSSFRRVRQSREVRKYLFCHCKIQEASEGMAYRSDNPLQTKRGCDLLIHEEHVYTKRLVANGVVYMRCEVRDCGGTARMTKLVDGSSHVVLGKPHTCIPAQNFNDEIINRQAVQQIKANTRNGVADAIATMRASLANPTIVPQRYIDSQSIAQLPSNILLGAMARREMRRVLHIPPGLLCLPTGELFIQYCGPIAALTETGDVAPTIILCYTDTSMRRMLLAQDLFCDATFGVVPSVFRKMYGAGSQMFTMHFIEFQRLFAGIYAIMPGKRTADYEFVLNHIKDYALNRGLAEPTWNSVMTDYEDAMRRACRNSGCFSHINGCYFHYAQCIYRHINATQPLRYLYNVPRSCFRLFARRIISLAHLPPDRVVATKAANVPKKLSYEQIDGNNCEVHYTSNAEAV